MTTPRDTETTPDTFPMRVAARLTGVSPERMRAWEARHGAIEPQRTDGGSRRYSHSDLDRLKLLRRVVEAGHPIREIAQLNAAELEARLSPALDVVDGDREPDDAFASILAAIERLDEPEIRHWLAADLEARGPVAFARETVLGLASVIGERWAAGLLSITAEHLVTAIMRSMLVELLAREPSSETGPRVIFAAVAEERHDLGLLTAALVAKAADATPIFVGADIPDADLVATVRVARAEAVALGFVTLPPDSVEAVLRSLRRALPENVAIWIGGAGIAGCAPVRGVDRIDHLDRLAAYVLELPSSAGVLRQEPGDQ